MAKLHQPLGGKDRGDDYSGKDEDFLSMEGYVAREDGKIVSGQAKNDQRLAENREAPGEKPPTPKTEVVTVEDHPEAFKRPELDPLDSRQVNQKAIDAKWKGVEAGERDPNNPDVVLADAYKAIQDSINYDGSPDKRVLANQESANKLWGERQEKLQTEASKKAEADYFKWLKDQGVQPEAKVPAERQLQKEQGIRTDAKAEVTGGNDPGATTEKTRQRLIAPSETRKSLH